MTPKYLKGFCALWAGWIYFSSSVVITRFQFSEAVSNITHLQNETAIRFFQAMWWITDRAYHVFEFAILSYLLLNAFSYFKKRPVIVFPVVAIVAALDEYHQSIVNFPAAHTYDVLIDAIGIAIAFWLFVRSEIKRDTLSATLSSLKRL